MKNILSTHLSKLALYISLSGWVILAIYVFAFIEREGLSFQIIRDFISTEEQGIRFRAPMLFGPLITSVLGYLLNESAKAENALIENKDKFEKLSERSLVGVYLIYDDLFRYVNPKMSEIFGYSIEEMTGRIGPKDLVYPEDWPFVEENIRKRLDFEMESIHYEFRCVRKDGTVIEVNAFGTRTMFEGRQAIIGSLIDITTRKRAEEALELSEQRFRRTFEGAGVGMAIVDMEGRLLETNNVLQDMLGFTSEELRNDVFAEFTHPEDAKKDMELYKELVKGERERYEMEKRYACKDGQLIWGNLTMSLVRDSNGAPKFAIGMVNDITARKLAEEELSESKRSLSTLMSNLPGMAYRRLNDPTWTMKFVSEGCAELTGYETGELTANARLPYREIIHPGDREQVWKSVQAALGDKLPFKLTYRIVRKDGETRWAWEMGQGVYSKDGELQALEGFVTDITDRKLAEDRTERQIQHLAALRKIDVAISSSLDLRMTLDVFVGEVITQLHVDAANVLILPPRTHKLEHVASKGFRGKAIERASLKLSESFSGTSALERKPIIMTNLEEAPVEFIRGFLVTDEEFKAYFAIPLIVKGQVKGVLEVFHRTPLEPEMEWLQLLESLAGQAAIAIDNANMFVDLQKSRDELAIAYDRTIEGWAKALDYRDKETEGHSQRVTEMTVRISREVGMVEEDIVHVRRGALLHDIGKLGVPDAILFKAAKLDDEEWRVMKRHPILAHELLSPIHYLRRALDIPYCHHEKWDGTGYPRGLKDEQIPLSARIFAVVDVWDALSSDRPYRAAWPREKIQNYLREESGKHFDPEIVDAFLKLKW